MSGNGKTRAASGGLPAGAGGGSTADGAGAAAGARASAAGGAGAAARSTFLAACRREPVAHTPIWLMRQAGRYLPEYRALREKHSMLDMIGTPELAAEVTLQPLRRFALDAAILFSDILPPLRGMGLDLDFVPGEGPRIGNPISRTYDIDVLGTPPAAEIMAPSIEAARIVARELGGEAGGDAAADRPGGGEAAAGDRSGAAGAIPLIGFAGAPFTLASYAIEGGGSKDYAKTKALMYTEPAAWKRLMTKLVTVQADYLLEQARAGASALMVFDSWCGIALGPTAYDRFIAPHTNALISKISSAGVPTILYTAGTGAYLERVVASGADVIGVDHRIDLAVAWEAVERAVAAEREAAGGDAAGAAAAGERGASGRGSRVAAAGTTSGGSRPAGVPPSIQGNLDPLALQAPPRELRAQVDAVLEATGGRAGHIFNLGHGVQRETDPDAVARLVDYVHERTAESRGAG